MKNIKKIFNLILVILLLYLSGCNIQTQDFDIPGNIVTIQDAINEAIIDLNDNDDQNSITSDLTFIEKYDEFEYQWRSNNEDVISPVGKVNRPLDDTEVIITLKISDDEEFLEKCFVFIVLKQEPVFDGYTYDLKNVKSALSIYELNEVNENGEYNNYLDVVAYIHIYHKLPSNYLTKSEAKSLGWSGSGSNVWQNNNLQGKYIGGDTFKNYEGYLPIIDNKTYVEVDVNCNGGKRGTDRIVYNRNNFDIYFTDDHYYTFIYMIGEVE